MEGLKTETTFLRVNELVFKHLLRLDESFHNGEFVTLKKLIEKQAILDSLDSTATARLGVDTSYDKENTGARIKFLASDGSVINNSSGIVADVALLVNMAGTADATSNAPIQTVNHFSISS